VVACLAILADKDAAAMIQALAPALDRAVCTELPADGPKTPAMPTESAPRRRGSHAAGDLARLCEAAGLAGEAEPRFDEALRRARALAVEAPGGALLVSGSHYVLARARISP
jgi:folylpolyglutamate synthase/dihydropteroate synthase